MDINLIVTGATGMVGEGVLFECLEHPAIKQVLMVNRKHYELTHSKLKELIVPDFFDLTKVTGQLTSYNACFFCAGVSSVGMKEPEYHHVTYDLTLNFAQTVANLNPDMIFTYVSGSHTDSSEKGRSMWARVKGKTENALMRLAFKKVYNFRPGIMKPTPGQKNIKGFYKVIKALYPFFHLIMPAQTSTLKEVGVAMINSVVKGYPKSILEISDIKDLAKG
ncbi:MAG: NAD-dependent epimerase/dehydratase family protein [Chitinophagaceae bacterium]